jgi:alpha-glucoside transport system substrate-binding protein
MAPMRTRGWRGALALALPLCLLASACADDDDGTDVATQAEEGELEGTTVTISGPEVEQEQDDFQASFAEFEERTGINVEIRGSRDFEEQIGVQIDGGNPPDIAMFPQPGKIQDFSDAIIPIPDDIVSNMEENFDSGWIDLVTIDGDVLGVPAKADLKSLVWYSPETFEENGYEIPETLEEFEELTDQMMADGNTPFCVGLASGAATGWPFTDWIEDFMLRLKGPEVYDQWVANEIPFDDPDVVEVGNYVYDLWSQEGFIYGGTQGAAATPFEDAGLPVLEGECMMHRQGNFYAANWPEGTELGEDGEVNAFYLPGSEEFGNVTLSGGIYAAALADRPEVMAVMDFLASTDYADARAPAGGFLSPNRNVNVDNYETEIERNFAEILSEADPVRFDASDLMPGEIGAGEFWTAGVDITTGAATVEEAFAQVEAAWPDD